MKPLPTLMRPLRSVDLASGSRARPSSSGATCRRSRRSRSSPRPRSPWELARAAREKFGGDALVDFVTAHRAYRERIRWREDERPRSARRARRVHGRREVDAGAAARDRLARPFVSVDALVEERDRLHGRGGLRGARGRRRFESWRKVRPRRPHRRAPTVMELGGGALGAPRRRERPRRACLHDPSPETTPEEAWRRVASRAPARARSGGVPGALRGAHAGLRGGLRRSRRRPRRRDPRRRGRARLGGCLRRPGLARAGRRGGRARRRRERRSAQGTARAARSEIALDAPRRPGRRARQDRGRGGADVVVAPPRPQRHDRRARRRLDVRPRRVRRGDPPPRSRLDRPFRPRSSARSTPRSAGRSGSTCPRARTSSARSTGPHATMSIPSCWRRFIRKSSRTAVRRSSRPACSWRGALGAGAPEQVRCAAAFKAAICLRDPDGPRRARAAQPRPYVRARARGGLRLHPPHGRAVALGLLAALRLSGLEDEARTVEDVLALGRVRSIASRTGGAQRDKKAVEGHRGSSSSRRRAGHVVNVELDRRRARPSTH